MIYRAINGLIRHAIEMQWILFVMKSAEFLNRYLKMPEYLREINKEKKHLQDL